MVIVDNFSNYVVFIPMKMSCGAEKKIEFFKNQMVNPLDLDKELGYIHGAT